MRICIFIKKNIIWSLGYASDQNAVVILGRIKRVFKKINAYYICIFYLFFSQIKRKVQTVQSPYMELTLLHTLYTQIHISSHFIECISWDHFITILNKLTVLTFEIVIQNCFKLIILYKKSKTCGFGQSLVLMYGFTNTTHSFL